MATVRIVCADFYMCNPVSNYDPLYSQFRGSAVNQVPIIRIFGSSKEGTKTCLHIHGVFPYVYIPYDGAEPVDSFMHQVAINLDKALNISFNRGSSNAQHIFKVTHVSGLPMYGYHSKEHQFLKLFFYNPLVVRKACTLLQEGHILGKRLQPYEAHLPFILQFMIDYNLHGMSFISVSKLSYRTDESQIKKVSVCEHEGDALADDILNKLSIESLAANPGILAIWEDEKQRRRNDGNESQISQCLTLDQTDVEPTMTHKAMKNLLTARFATNDFPFKYDGNASVYPAESLDTEDLLNASSIDSHSSSQSVHNFTDISCLETSSKSSGEEAIDDLYDVLMGLKQDNKENMEEDSILTQLTQKEKDDSYEEVDEVDMTLPLEELDILFEDFESSFSSLPQQNEELSKKSEKNKQENLLSLDGACDSSDDEVSQTSPAKRYSQLPILVQSPSRKMSSSKIEKRSKKNENLSTTIVKEQIVCKLKGKTENIVCLNKTAVNNSKVESNEKEEHLILNENITNNAIKSQNALNNSIIEENKDVNASKIELNDYKEFYTENNATKDLEINNETKHNNLTSTDAESMNLNLTISFTNKNDLLEINESPKSHNDTLINLDDTIIDEDTFLNDTIINETVGGNLLIPKCAAPTRNEILETLNNFDIPQIKYQTPFYSNFKDVTGNVEIGTEVLRINSVSVQDCLDFQSSFTGIYNYRCDMLEMETAVTKNVMDAVVMSYCNEDKYLITPVKAPPTRKEIEESIKIIDKPVVEVKKEKKKIIMPFSPGMDVDYDNSMVLTPCTPVSSGESNKTQGEICTPKVKRNKESKSLAKQLFLSEKVSQNSSSGELPQDNSCNITGVTLNNTFNFKMSLENMQNAKSVHEHQFLTTMIMELHCQTRGNFKPDPSIDPIKAIFYLILEDAPGKRTEEGAIIITPPNKKPNLNMSNVELVKTELELFESFINVFNKYNPDICLGYEIEMQSWGYLVDRGYTLELNLVKRLSRIVSENIKYSDDDDKDLKFTGRILLNLWRLMRHEIALQSYTFESIVFHILHQRCPLYSYKDLSFWWEHPSYLYYNKVVNYYMYRLQSMVRLLDQLDLIGRTSELARLFGIQFYEVLSRGSQFRVESMMLRSAKPLNYIPVSPSVQQRAKMKAPEFLALILEPESKFYVDPIIVLDFQSLYPSMIIAYNYCFSTCLGRIEHLGRKDAFEFGACQLRVNPKLVEKFLNKDQLNFSPCGVAFVKESVRKGVLPQMLQEILGTRLMVKKSMKMYKDNKTLQRVLHSRQLGLKLIANVTYGYTAANFSGRMPLVELGDSVVSKGRETLYRAIKMVEANERWNAKVVYGDTDSMFVMVKGRSKEEAFQIGEEIAQAVTDDNPNPVKLKLEKVYLPCILQTKKRYVGYMYESSDQAEPEFEAKGIETVRRDGCPAVSKMLEKTLRILFETRDISNVRKYVERQMNKVITGRISVQDLTFAKEYRGQSGYRPGACVPSLELARKWMLTDKRSEPRSGERVPYVIINGPPGLPLIKLVRSPYELLNDSSLRLNALYYITKVIIPPINRCFTLIGADLNNWFKDLPRKQFTYLPVAASLTKKSTISQYFSTVNCAVCGQQTREGLCQLCINNSQKSVLILQDKILNLERAFYETNLICQSCSGSSNCISLDCPVLYRLEQTKRDVKQVPYITELIAKNF